MEDRLRRQAEEKNELLHELSALKVRLPLTQTTIIVTKNCVIGTGETSYMFA
jgi:hypothetical protein